MKKKTTMAGRALLLGGFVVAGVALATAGSASAAPAGSDGFGFSTPGSSQGSSVTAVAGNPDSNGVAFAAAAGPDGTRITTTPDGTRITGFSAAGTRITSADPDGTRINFASPGGTRIHF